MISNLYTVFDKVAEEAGPIFQAKNNGIALRQYHELLKNSVVKDDYALYQLGIYDSEKMTIVLVEPAHEVLF